MYCAWRIPAHLRCTQCSILLHLMDICFLTCICLWQISQIQTFLFKVVGPGLVSTSPAFVSSSASHPAGPPISLSISPKNSDIVMPDKTSQDINNKVDVQIPSQNDGTLDTNQNSTCDFQENPSNMPWRRSNRNVSKPVKFKDYEM